MLHALLLSVVAVAGNEPFLSFLPPFGLTAPYQAKTNYTVFGISDDGRYLLRNAFDPAYPTEQFHGIPIAVDLQSGATARLDLTESGAIPALGQCCIDSKILAFSGDARFVLFYSNSPSYGVPQAVDTGSVYWVDRDSDQDGIFDELAARRVVRIAILHEEPYPLGPAYGIAALSDDGRHAAFRFPNHSDPDRVELRLADLDSDDDGLLAEPGEIDLRRVVGEPSGGPFPIYCEYPTFSKDARFLAFDRYDEQVQIGWRVSGGELHWLYSSPPDYPLVRRTIVLDRDSDENGIFDEPNTWSYTDLGAVVGASPVDASTMPQFARERDELIFVYSRKNLVVGQPLERHLASYDPHSHAVSILTPTASGVMADSLPSSRFTCDGTARRIYFSTNIPKSGPGVTFETEFAVLDRDVDRDGVFDELGETQSEVLTLPSDPWIASILGVSTNVDIAVMELFPAGSSFDPLGVYGKAWIDFDCSGSVTYDLESCQTPIWAGVQLYGFGCPTAGETFVLEADGTTTLAPLAWLVIGTPTAGVTNPCVLGFSTIEFAVPLMLEVLPVGTGRHAKYAFQFPPNFPPGTFELRAVAYNTLFGKQVMSRRLRITTP